MTITGSGNVGIGATSPQRRLSLYKTVSSSCDIFNSWLCSDNDNLWMQFVNSTTGTTSSDGFQIGLTAPNNHAYISNRTSGGYIFFETNNQRRMEIANSGEIQTYGNLHINGNLSKGGGTFHIDHPLDPANKDLYHGFVEAPRYDLIYRGMVQLKNGRATVNIDAASSMTDGTFDALTQNPQVFLQNDSGFATVKGKVKKGTLSIECADAKSNDTIGWLVIAERADAYVKNNSTTDANGHLLVEVDKPEPTAEELALLKDKVEVVADGGQAAKDDVGAEDVVELSGKRGYPIHPKAFGKAQPQRKVIRKHVKKTESPAAHGFE